MPEGGSFHSSLLVEIGGIESLEYFPELIQANDAQIALQPIASEKETYPSERETIKTAGLKMKAAASKATVVEPVPVHFCCKSSIATSSVVGGAITKKLKRRNSVWTILRLVRVAHTLTILG